MNKTDIQPLPFRPAGQKPPGGSGRRYRRFIAPAVGLIFLLLLLVAWFVFTARQVTLQIEPPPDRLNIDGALFAPRLGDRFLLRPGTYRLNAAKTCYAPLEQSFDVSPAGTRTIRFQMQRLAGRLSLQAHKTGAPATPVTNARIFIDGRAVGRTPLADVKVAAGRRVVEIKAENYQQFKTEIQITGCPEKQSLTPALVPNWSDVSLSSIPSGATVSVDGQPAGTTPLTIELKPGDHLLALSAAGFKTWQTRLTVTPNTPQTFKDVRLAVADGTLDLQTRPSGANVTIDQQFAGTTPLTIPLAAGTPHDIRIAKAGYKKASRRIQVDSEEEKRLTVELTPILGVIRLTVTPANARLILNGKPKGTVPPELKLLAVSHRLEITQKGYRPYRTRITPRPGFAQEIKISLQPVHAEPAKPAGTIQAPNGYPLKRIRPGTFTMGSSRREQGRRSNETLRRITLRRPFYFGVREVTNREFRAFAARHNSGTAGGQRLSPAEHPVAQVTWQQAARFCNWLSTKASLPPVYIKKGDRLIATEPLGTGFRLPTEAEWEYCARIAPDQSARKYPWGDRYPPEEPVGNYADTTARTLLPAHIENYTDGYAVSAPVAKFPANAWGVFDLDGNVAEWCHDFYTIYSYDGTTTAIDPTGPAAGKHHVIKGASWRSAGISKLRSAYRDYSEDKRIDLGFRICRYAE